MTNYRTLLLIYFKHIWRIKHNISPQQIYILPAVDHRSGTSDKLHFLQKTNEFSSEGFCKITKKVTKYGPHWHPWIYLGRVSLWGSLHKTENTQLNSKWSIDTIMLIVMTALSVWMVKNQCVGSLLLGHDQRNAGTVGLQRRTLVAGPAVEHGQRGQWRRNAAASSHVPELVRVPVDGLVVVQLDSAAQRNTQILF